MTHVTHGDRLPTMSPEWVAVEMAEGGATSLRLHGNFEGGFAMAAVGAGYHDAFGAKIVAGRGLHTADAGTPNGPVVVNEAFMRVLGRNPLGSRVRTLQRGSEREPGPWREIVGVVADLEMLFPGVRRTGAPGAAGSTDRGAAAALTCVLGPRDRGLSSIVWTIVTSVFFMGALAFGATGLGKRLRLYSLATIAIVFACGAWSGTYAPEIQANLPTTGVGVWERINTSAFMIWIVVLAAFLLRTGTSQER